MSGAARLEQAIRRTAEHRPALAAFLTAGFPEMESFGSLLDRVAGEAEVVEVGVPFTDPMADGVTIQESSRRALAAGVTLPWILDTVERAACDAVVLMSYLNPVIAMGLPAFARRASDAGVAGAVVAVGWRRQFSLCVHAGAGF